MEFITSFLNKQENTPLYYQLYSALVESIRMGGIPAGERLPGKRSAAQQLGVSVNTVDEAYQMLSAEGYVEARPRSGFVVNRVEQLVPPPRGAARAQLPAANASAVTAMPGPAQHEEGPGRWRYSFSTGDIDTALFPHKTWNRLFREVLSGQPGLLGRGLPQGDAVLRDAIVRYLRGYRGVRCEAGQVVVGAGLEVLTGLLARLLAGQAFALEDPGYPKAGHVLRNMGVRTKPVPVDAAGMVPAALAESGAQVAYLTPSHQFPTGGVMPVGRRTELLQWAQQAEHYILEDDYDSEFRFDGRPLPCLQGLDKAGRVVYAGTFSRSLAPGLRAAYLVLPPALLQRWRQVYGDYACTVSRPEQHTLARLMGEGHFARSLNRVRAAYRHRRDALLQALGCHMPAGSCETHNTHTGLYFILRLPGCNAMAVAQQARAAGIRLRALGEYAATHPQQSENLLLGYGGLEEKDMDAAVLALAKIIRLNQN